MDNLITPTKQAYEELQWLYEFFNDKLFDNTLPVCLITLQRVNRVAGYFHFQRFRNEAGTSTDEIAINPHYFARVSLSEIFQTLVHEMVHLWQYHNGTPSRRAYHNVEWANKMESLGLMPSTTGKPGGKRVGQHMADYSLVGGPFLIACDKLRASNFSITWFDSAVLSTNLDGSLSAATGGQPTRRKYTCGCGFNVWGKPTLLIRCDICKNLFSETAA